MRKERLKWIMWGPSGTKSSVSQSKNKQLNKNWNPQHADWETAVKYETRFIPRWSLANNIPYALCSRKWTNRWTVDVVDYIAAVIEEPFDFCSTTIAVMDFDFPSLHTSSIDLTQISLHSQLERHSTLGLFNKKSFLFFHQAHLVTYLIGQILSKRRTIIVPLVTPLTNRPAKQRSVQGAMKWKFIYHVTNNWVTQHEERQY